LATKQLQVYNISEDFAKNLLAFYFLYKLFPLITGVTGMSKMGAGSWRCIVGKARLTSFVNTSV